MKLYNSIVTGVSTLPIRNGNYNPSAVLASASARSFNLVSTLPIRNGNTYCKAYTPPKLISKYLTYKEWKLFAK